MALAIKSMQEVGTSLLQTTCSLWDSTVTDKTYLADQSSQICITEHSFQKTGEQGPACLFPCPFHFFLKGSLPWTHTQTHTDTQDMQFTWHVLPSHKPAVSWKEQGNGPSPSNLHRAPEQCSQESWTCSAIAHSSPDTPQEGRYTTQAGNGQPGQLLCLACCSSDKPWLRAQVTVVNAGS